MLDPTGSNRIQQDPTGSNRIQQDPTGFSSSPDHTNTTEYLPQSPQLSMSETHQYNYTINVNLSVPRGASATLTRASVEPTVPDHAPVSQLLLYTQSESHCTARSRCVSNRGISGTIVPDHVPVSQVKDDDGGVVKAGVGNDGGVVNVEDNDEANTTAKTKKKYKRKGESSAVATMHTTTKSSKPKKKPTVPSSSEDEDDESLLKFSDGECMNVLLQYHPSCAD